MIAAEEIGRRFGRTVALDRVSFTARDGEALGFLGPNGAGKTTMIRILTGLLKPTEGRVFIDGIAMEEAPFRIKKKIGYLPESNPLYGDMRVCDYLRFAAAAKGVPKHHIEDRTDTVIMECGLAGWEHRMVGKLSKGYRQRVGLAQAVINDPSFVILDEPTSGLDPGQIVEFRSLIRGLKGKRTVLLSTHILPDASAICDRVLILRKGRIVAVDTVEELGRRLRPSAEWVLSVSGPREEVDSAFRNINGIMDLRITEGKIENEWIVTARTDRDTDPRQEFVQAVVKNGFRLLELRPSELSLEDVFLDLMTEDPR
jgi:ABC-2 type transport system ATP-binding protein